jgi:hypothetical protein
MLRSSVLVFIAGWIVWFWIDKPRAGPYRLPPASDSLLENFQRAFDILKAGQLELAYVYIWNAHYLVLSLIGGVLLAMIYRSISNQFSRRRLRNLMFPKRQRAKAADEASGQSRSGTPPSAEDR